MRCNHTRYDSSLRNTPGAIDYNGGSIIHETEKHLYPAAVLAIQRMDSFGTSCQQKFEDTEWL